MNRCAEIKNEISYIQNILDSQNSIIIIYKDGNIKFVNKRYFDYFKKESVESLYEALKQNFEGYTFDEWVKRAYESKEEIKLSLFDENDYTLMASVKKLQNTDEYIITFSDITKLSLYKKSLVSSNQLLRDYKRAIDLSTIVSKTTKNGIITYVNDKFVKMFEYSEEELIGKRHSLLRDPSMSDEFFKDMWKTILDKKVWKGIVKNRSKSGKVYFLDTIITPIFDDNGDIKEFISIRVDITELIEAKQKAQDAVKAKTRFLANMSHEIRTPLNAIMGFTNILLKRDLPSDVREIINTIDGSADTLLGIVNDILDISKIEHEGISIKNEKFNPKESFKNLVELLKVKIDEKNIDFKLDMDLCDCMVADEHRLKQVISNLIGNAIKFTPEYGKIELTIKTVEKGEDIEFYFSIKDTGVGISKSQQENIFKPFEQEDYTTTKNFGGTGLGLSISSKIIEKMGSKINLESEKGVGSRFYFTLNFKKCKRRVTKELPKESKKLTGRVLIAEDHPVNQALIKALLDLKGDIEKVVVENGKIALERYKQDSFDLILMDINMPVMSGEDSCKKIKEYEKKNNLAHTPIIALTANSMQGDKERYLELGFDDYLPKPLQEKDLDEVLRKYLKEDESSLSIFVKETNLNKDIYLKIVKLFFENINTDLKMLKDAIDSNDYEAIADIAHKIAGSSGAVRFSDIRKMAKEMENFAVSKENVDYKEFITEIERSLVEYKKMVL